MFARSTPMNLQHAADIKKAAKVMKLFANFGDVEGQIQSVNQLVKLAAENDSNRDLIREEGAFEVIVKLAFEPKELAQLMAVRALAELAQNTENCKIAIEQNVLSPIARMLQSDDWALQTAAVKCLVVLFAKEDARNHASVLDSGVVQALCQMDREHKNVEAHADLARVLNLISQTPSLQQDMYQCDGIQTLVRLSEGAPEYVVRIEASKALGNLSTTPAFGDEIVKLGGVPVIVNCLADYSFTVQESVLETLNHLDSDAATIGIARAPDSFRHIVACCQKRTAKDEEIPEKVRTLALRLIVRLCKQRDLLQQLLDNNVLQILLGFGLNTSDAAQQFLAVKGFAVLLRAEEVRDLFFDESSGDALLNVLFLVGNQHLSNYEVSSQVCVCLQLLSRLPSHQQDLVNVPSRLNLLLKFAQLRDLETQRTAAETLSVLAANSVVAKFLSPPDVLKILIDLTKSRDEEVLKYGAMAVSHVAFAGGASKSIAENGGLKTLIQFGYSKNPRMQIQAATALASIALNSKIESSLMDEGGIQLLQKLLRSKNPDVVNAAKRAMSNFYAMKQLKELASYAVSDSKPVDSGSIQQLLDNVQDSQHIDVMRVGLLAISNLMNDPANANIFQKKRGAEVLCKFIDPDFQLPAEHDMWREEVVLYAIRGLGKSAHNEEMAKDVLVKSPAVSVLIRQLSIQSIKFASIHIECCQALGQLASFSVSVQKRIFAEQGIEPLVMLLNARMPKVQIAAAGVLEMLCSDDRHAVRVMEEGALTGLLNMVDSNADNGNVARAATVVIAQLCRADDNHAKIIPKLGWSTILTLVNSTAVKSKIAMAQLIMRVANNKAFGGQYKQEILTNGLLPPIVHMAQSSNTVLLVPAAKTLAALATAKQLRDEMKRLGVLNVLSAMSTSSNLDVRQASAEVLANLVDIEGEDKGSGVAMDTTTLSALIALTNAGDGPYQCKAAEALALVAESYHGKVRITELGGVLALLGLAKSSNLNAQRPALRALKQLSSLAKNQHDIVEAKGLTLLLSIISHETPTQDDEIEELALSILANLAINANNEHRIVKAGGKKTLIKLAQGHHDPDADPEATAKKVRIARVALTNMESSKLFAELAGYSGWFPRRLKEGEVKQISQLLEDNQNTGVEREVARALGNVSGQADNMKRVIAEGGVDAILALSGSPDAEVQASCARAVAVMAVNGEARAMLSKAGVVDRLTAALMATDPLQMQPDARLDILTALANMCVLPELTRSTLKIVRGGALHLLVRIVSGTSAFPPDDQYQAARILASMNYVPDAN
eukprot:c4550_g1_i1.p1 GENE.c4550_g1_i1~~c4550_g1_i1.p1  ORF type:complete len:1289 (+),score=388.64 c4550_g1_i1:28-3894(+)